MKLKATRKEIKNGYRHILSIGYCALQTLLNYESPFAYSTRVEGWSCDYYDIDGVCISTGYSTIGKYVDYELIREYENKAQNKSREERSQLLSEFVKKTVNLGG